MLLIHFFLSLFVCANLNFIGISICSHLDFTFPCSIKPITIWLSFISSPCSFQKFGDISHSLVLPFLVSMFLCNYTLTFLFAIILIQLGVIGKKHMFNLSWSESLRIIFFFFPSSTSFFCFCLFVFATELLLRRKINQLHVVQNYLLVRGRRYSEHFDFVWWSYIKIQRWQRIFDNHLPETLTEYYYR